MEIVAIMNIVTLSLKAAKELAPVVNGVKEWINGLFLGGVITAEEQAKVHAYVDNVVEAFTTGNVPEWWKVQPD